MIFGQIVLYSWPLVVFVIFRVCSKPVALLIAILAGYLFLPTQIAFDLPLLPEFNKDTIPAIAAFLALLMFANRGNDSVQSGWMPNGTIPKILVMVLVTGAFLTVVTNGDALIYGPVVVPALRPWDGFSYILTTLVMLLPFFLGRKLLATPDQQRIFLIALAIAGGVYSFLALYEIRMSPQLNNIVYGFFPHAWDQHVRNGGFRPIVFVHHGLWLSIFFSATILAAFGAARIAANTYRHIYIVPGIWLLLTLVLSKSLGALIITVILAPIVLLMGAGRHLMVSASLATVVLIYPLLRSADLIPIDQIMQWVHGISAERAASLEFRLNNEDLLLERALQRPAFGWGGWGRNFVLDDSGEEIAGIADGYWVLVIGLGGWIRYLGEFGLLCLSLIMAFFQARRFQIGFETSVLSLILVGNLVDLIPNATITPLTWLLAGSIWGRLELGRIAQADQDSLSDTQTDGRAASLRATKDETKASAPHEAAKPPPGKSGLRYTRQKTRIERRRFDG